VSHKTNAKQRRYTEVPSNLLQRKCACEKPGVVGEKRDDCEAGPRLAFDDFPSASEKTGAGMGLDGDLLAVVPALRCHLLIPTTSARCPIQIRAHALASMA
jgi:hypothetical protein